MVLPAALVVGVVGVAVYVTSFRDDGTDRRKGGQIGSWSTDERSAAQALCVGGARAYTDSTCRVRTFCHCAVRDYEGRAPFREFRDSLVGAVVAYARKGSYGYFCTDRTDSECTREDRDDDDDDTDDE